MLNIIKKNKPKKIFISHSSNDSDIIKQLVDLLCFIGINKEEYLFCSSVDGFGVLNGENIYERIKKEFLENELFVIFFISDNFYKSTVCLNEMGATWIKDFKYQIVLSEDFKIKNVEGVVSNSNLAFKLSNTSNLNDFKNILLDFLKLPNNIANNTWENYRDKFINNILLTKKEIFDLTKSRIFANYAFDENNLHIIEQSKNMLSVKMHKNINGIYWGIVVIPKIKDWSNIKKMYSFIEFELHCDNITNFEIELKNNLYKEEIYKYSYIVSPTNKYKLHLNELNLNEECYGYISEFVILFNKKHFNNPFNVILKDICIE